MTPRTILSRNTPNSALSMSLLQEFKNKGQEAVRFILTVISNSLNEAQRLNDLKVLNKL